IRLPSVDRPRAGRAPQGHYRCNVAPMFLGEDPFHIETILAKTLFVPFYYGKAGLCAIVALEMACWDLKAKAVDRPLCDLLGGRLRDEVPFASYIFYRLADAEGRGRVSNVDEVVASLPSSISASTFQQSSSRVVCFHRRKKSQLRRRFAWHFPLKS